MQKCRYATGKSRMSQQRWMLPMALILPTLAVASAPSGEAADYSARLDHALEATPLVDGHNDLPWILRERFQSRFPSFDLAKNTAELSVPTGAVPLMTDIPRMRAGRVGGQFWSVWVPEGPEAVQTTLEQIDFVKRLAGHYPKDLEMAYSAADVRRIHRAGRIACLIGIEGGHQINNSLAVLRQMYNLGARYMTLTHSANTAWADSATDGPVHNGLTPFGREIVREMNRLGMLVDLSHVAPKTMSAALAVAEAPVIFSHSSARALVDHPRDVPDDVLRKVAANGGIVMVNFYAVYVSEVRNRWGADYAGEKARESSPPFGGLYIGQPERAKEALADWEKEHPRPNATLGQVANHIEHIRDIAGVDHVGLGSDFDGMDEPPAGLENVARFPALLTELMRRGWTDDDVAKVAGGNLLRVMTAVEAVAAKLRTVRVPSSAKIEDLDGAPIGQQ
jgi:membrane dipeptidase